MSKIGFCHTGPNWLKQRCQAFRRFLGRHISALTTPQPHETLFSSSVPARIICYLCLFFISTPFVQGESSEPKTAKSSIWKLGIGWSSPVAETKTRGVLELVRAWSPHFVTGWLNSFDHKGFKLLADRISSRPCFPKATASKWLPGKMTKYYPQGLSYFSAILGRPWKNCWEREANPKGLPTYWTLATNFPTGVYQQTLIIGQLRYYSSDAKFTPGQSCN